MPSYILLCLVLLECISILFFSATVQQRPQFVRISHKKKSRKSWKKNQFWKSWKKLILKKLEKINFEKVGKKSWKSSKAFLHCSPQEAPSGTPGRSPQKTIAPQPVCIIELPGQLQYNKPIKKNCYHICSMYAQWNFCLSKDNKNSYANNQATEIGKKKIGNFRNPAGFQTFLSLPNPIFLQIIRPQHDMANALLCYRLIVVLQTNCCVAD